MRTLFWLLFSAGTLFAAAQRDKIDPELWTPAAADFRSYYGWDDAVGSWTWFKIRSDLGDDIAIHVWENGDVVPVGTIFLLHGFLEHSAARASIAGRLVADGWLCAGADLPGHGLSSGVRGDIDYFIRYAKALDALTVSRAWPRPWVFLGHSTGCAAALSYLYDLGGRFDYQVFEAPLVRSYLWEPSLFGNAVLGGIVTYLPPRYASGPDDPALVAFRKRDPLFVDRFPMSWMNALVDFENQTRLWPELAVPLLILQGMEDSVVDSRYNIPFLTKLFPLAEIKMINGGGHQLLQGAAAARNDSWAILQDRLASVLAGYR